MSTYLDLRPKVVVMRLIISYALICLFMWGFQRHLIYLPSTHIQPPAMYGLQDFAELSLTTKDKTRITAWYHKAKSGYPTIIYFHGNGGNLGGRARYFQLLSTAGFGVLGLDYRGYGHSEGTPSEGGFYDDARATMEYALKQLSIDSAHAIVYGESIGTGVAVEIATQYPVAALVLQSPFTSLEAVAQGTYPWLPVHLLLTDRFDSLSKITRVHALLLLLHGESDTVVPVTLGKDLFDHAPGDKEAVYYPGHGHNDLDVARLTHDLIAFCNSHAFIQSQ